MVLSHRTLQIVCFLCFMVSTCLALRCLQCNMRQMGVANTCDKPRTMPDCVGCMKTITKIKLRDSGFINGKERLSKVVSRYCMRHGATYVKKEGCYKHANNGGYTERCFCYSDLCNTGSTLTSAISSSIAAIVLSLISGTMTILRHL